MVTLDYRSVIDIKSPLSEWIREQGWNPIMAHCILKLTKSKQSPFPVCHLQGESGDFGVKGGPGPKGNRGRGVRLTHTIARRPQSVLLHMHCCNC